MIGGRSYAHNRKLSAQINATTECSCGAEKLPSQQWCEICWEILPVQTAKGYNRCARELGRRIAHCEKRLILIKSKKLIKSKEHANKES